MFKNKTEFLTPLLGMLIMGLIFLFLLGGAALANSQEKTGLFTQVEHFRQTDDRSNDPVVTRTNYVLVDFSHLNSSATGDNLQLNLFPAEDYSAKIISAENLESGGRSWVGVLDGVDHSQVILVEGSGQIAGIVSMPGAFYSIRHVSDGVHAIDMIDQSKYPPEMGPIPIEAPELPEAFADTLPQEDDGVVVDLLVVFTPQARLAAGGMTAIHNLINLAVVETNQSYANSGISHRIKLVHAAEVDYSESGNMYTDLNRLTTNNDGYLDQVHALREAYNADLVTMIEESFQYCGIAWLMTDVGTWFAPYGFNIVARNCATGYFSFGHEIGHNMGARHDWYVDNTLDSPYSYNKGFVNVEDEWRTIMAYNSECTYHQVSCTRLQYWSNPEVNYWGDPMGVQIGTSTDCDRYDPDHPACDADNRKTLNDTAAVVANFQNAQGSSGPLVFESYSVSNLTYFNGGAPSSSAVCGSDIELEVVLENAGTSAVENIQAEISISSDYFEPGTMTSTYPDIPGETSAGSSAPFTMSIDENAPQGLVSTVDINITSSSGGPWFDSFELPVVCEAGLQVEPRFSTGAQSEDTVSARWVRLSNNGNQGLTWEIVEQNDGQNFNQFSEPAVENAGSGDPTFAREDDPGQPPSPNPGAEDQELVDTAPGFVYPESVLYDNGPYVNSPGSGGTDYDKSVVQKSNLGMITIGYGHQYLLQNRIADDFTIPGPEGWTIDAITFFGYQTGSTIVSPFLSINYRIWNGKPGEPGSVVVYGDTVTNQMVSTAWTSAYRVIDDNLDNTDRPIMANQVTADVYLPPGTYWLDWQANGSPNYSGPYAPPITINGQDTTGNAVQYTNSWQEVVDTATVTPQGFPFIIEGSPGGSACTSPADIPWLEVSPASGAVSPGESQDIQLILDSAGLDKGIYSQNICISTNDPTNNPYIMEVELLVGAENTYFPLSRR